MATIYAKYASGSCDNCKKNISARDKIPAFIVKPCEDLQNIELFLCEECARKVKGYAIQRYFELVDEAKRKNK